MLTAEMNERMTQVGPGTPMGELFRRYWLPVAATVELKDKATKKVRILGEDLALFQDRTGKYGLVAELCPHRRCSLAYGVPENEGIRCPYHGWLFDSEGNCLEQPAESPNSTFKDRIKTVAYPVKEMGGLLFGYMGPLPAPILPKYDYFVQPNSLRQIGLTELPCNWLQIMENSLDPTHSEWLHSWFSYYLRHGKSQAADGAFPQRRHAKIGFDVFKYGITKRRYYEGGSEEDNDWQIGHPILFPHILKQGDNFQIRVPVDDENSIQYRYTVTSYPGVQAPEQEFVPLFDYPRQKENGELLVDWIPQQDMMAWVTQGRIGDRTVEHLGASDRGLLVYRKLLEEQMLLVAAGQDPLGVLRDPADDVQIDIPIDSSVPPLTTTSVRSAGRVNLSADPAATGVLRQIGDQAVKRTIDPEVVANAEKQIRRGQNSLSPVLEEMVQMRLDYLQLQLAAETGQQHRAG